MWSNSKQCLPNKRIWYWDLHSDTVFATKFEPLQNSKQNNHRIEAGVYASECAQCTQEKRENAAS